MIKVGSLLTPKSQSHKYFGIVVEIVANRYYIEWSDDSGGPIDHGVEFITNFHYITQLTPLEMVLYGL